MAKRLKKEVVFARRVDHPGTKPQPYLEPAVEKAFKLLRERLIPRALKNAAAAGGGTEALYRELDAAARASAFKGLEVALVNVPVDQGGLKDSLTVSKRGDMVYTVGTNLKYGRWVEEGTRKHPIFPRRASVLRFTVKRPRTS